MAAKNRKKQNSNGVQQAIVNNQSADSPLKLFGEAKDKINGLYLKLDRCVSKACQFYYSEDQLDSEVLKKVDKDRLMQLNRSICTIKGVLSRDQMKVAFFGRTSSGKSTVINAILHDRVLPMGCGHTTRCFLQIEGNQQEEAFLQIQKDGQGDHKQPVQSVSHIANALKNDSLENSTLVKIYWPISKCPLLKYDVVFVDSPGVYLNDNLDQWIDEHCHDADLFVLISNAELELDKAEKYFFHKVSEKLSKPNILVLYNKWDRVAEDPESIEEEVKLQHTDLAVDFLSEELKVSTQEEAREHTFFVSGKETLQARLGTNDPSEKKDGYDNRCEEFLNFERRFEESLSKSAVKTKFKKHTDKGRETIVELSIILKDTQSQVSQVSQRKLIELNRDSGRFASIQELFYNNEDGLQKQIYEVKKRIQIVSDTEFDNEVRRLSRVVEDFDLDFSLNPEKLSYYKQQLYLHVEDCLSENLRSRINMVINKHVNPFNKAMCEISMLLSEDRQQKIRNIVTSQQYIQDDLFDLRIYKQFYTEFQEDLEFRFSLGLVSIIRKFQGNKTIAGNSALDQSFAAQATMSANTDLLSILERFMMNPPQSPTTVGSLAVGGILVRTVGWKVIVITTVVYGALYAFEYLTWTNTAKERTFKAQYVRHAKRGLQGCGPIISQHIANSVEQKMTDTFSKVKMEVDIESSGIETRIGLLKRSLDKLRICDEFTREVLGESDVLMTELVAFATSFLGA